MIQMPRPCVAITEIVVARMDGEVAHRDGREVAALVLRPLLAAVERDPEAELGAEEEQVAVHEILLDRRARSRAPVPPATTSGVQVLPKSVVL